jgi:hypothetical protein
MVKYKININIKLIYHIYKPIIIYLLKILRKQFIQRNQNKLSSIKLIKNLACKNEYIESSSVEFFGI